MLHWRADPYVTFITMSLSRTVEFCGCVRNQTFGTRDFHTQRVIRADLQTEMPKDTQHITFCQSASIPEPWLRTWENQHEPFEP